MRLRAWLKPIAVTAVLAGLVATGYTTRDRWVSHFQKPEAGEHADAGHEAPASVAKILVNEKAQQNLGLTAKPLKPRTFWKTIPVPGMVVDRPGHSDRSVVAPAAGVISRIAHTPGDTVRPGDELFMLKLLSEPVLAAQTELFKATLDIKLAQAELTRLMGIKDTIKGTEIIEANNRLARLEASVGAYRHELQTLGFSPEQIDGVTAGKYVRELRISVPSRPVAPAKSPPEVPSSSAAHDPPPVFEVQELKVDHGQQVQAGQPLCTLANHQHLAIEGRAFRDETPLLEKSVREKWPVEVDFQEDAAAEWGAVNQAFRVRNLANTIDPANRTFAFLVPLENQSRVVEDDGRTQTLWRFRPGQKVRIHVRVEKLDNVFVLPAEAVARDGPEAFVFTQNVDTFERVPIRVLFQDRQQVVLANDGSLPAGVYVAQAGAAQLNRMLKAGGSGGVPKGYHMHADGSLHKNHDVEK